MTADGMLGSRDRSREEAPWAEASLPPGESADRLSLLVCQRSLRQTRISDLEASAVRITSETVRSWFESDLHLREVALLRTCQRVTLIALVDRGEAADALVERLGAPGAWEVRRDEDAIRWLYRLAAGLDSRATGEREIRDQMGAVATSVLSRHPRPVVRSILQAAVTAARRLERPPPVGSVADLAAAWLLSRLSEPNAAVLVIGAGTVGRRVAEALSGHAQVCVLYRRHAPDPRWCARWGVRLCRSEEMAKELRSVQAVVAAAKTLGRVLSLQELPSDPLQGPRWFVDLGLPRNIDPDIGRRPFVELVDLECLPVNPLGSEERKRLYAATDAASAEGMAEWARVRAEARVSQLRSWAEELRKEEWELALAHAGPIPEQARRAFELSSDRLVRRLLAGPTTVLRDLPTDLDSEERRRRLIRMFRDGDAGP